MKSRLVLQDEAVPGESINNLVSRDYESDLPKRIRGTDALLRTQVSGAVWDSRPSAACARPENLTPLQLLHVPVALACVFMGVRAFEFGGT